MLETVLQKMFASHINNTTIPHPIKHCLIPRGLEVSSRENVSGEKSKEVTSGNFESRLQSGRIDQQKSVTEKIILLQTVFILIKIGVLVYFNYIYQHSSLVSHILKHSS